MNPFPLEEPSPFPKDTFSHLAEVEDNHWWFRSRNNLLLWVLKSKVSHFNNFLEVGCGTGYVIQGISKVFKTAQLEASEYYSEGILIAQQRVPNCLFRQLDATAMAEVRAYDCIGSFDVIEHIHSDERVLLNFHRALRKGGFLLLTVPQHRWLWSAADDNAHHIRRYKSAELHHKVLSAGFEITYSTSFVSLLLPLMIVQRLSSRSKEYNLDDEFKIHPALNSFLYLIMQFEFLLLRVGLQFPLGGSRLMLARKP